MKGRKMGKKTGDSRSVQGKRKVLEGGKGEKGWRVC